MKEMMKEWKVILILSIAICFAIRMREYGIICNLDWLVDILQLSNYFVLLIVGVALFIFGSDVLELFIFASVVVFACFLTNIAFTVATLLFYALAGAELPLEIDVLVLITVAVKLFRKRKTVACLFVGNLMYLILGSLVLIIITLLIITQSNSLWVIIIEIVVGYFIYINTLRNGVLLIFFQENYVVLLFAILLISVWKQRTKTDFPTA